MDHTLLVSVHVPVGAEILRALDAASLNIKVAAWMVLPEYEDWRLILASPTFDEAGISEAYGLINKALDRGEIPVARQPLFMTLPMTDPTIRELRRRKARHMEGVRLGGMIGGRFIEDGYVYRIS